MKLCIAILGVVFLMLVCENSQAQCPGGVCPVVRDLGRPGTPVLDKIQASDRPVLKAVAAPFKAVADRKPVRRAVARARLFRWWR